MQVLTSMVVDIFKCKSMPWPRLDGVNETGNQMGSIMKSPKTALAFSCFSRMACRGEPE